ncbi:type II toxin-antitoxin system Phd/YefM family antitoxin [Candidatus Microgenomates bacterium]|nr:type II toxin-antitoxin system Phd/YefM family antitoxin [Candidatus Microgenomates bacterium]
MDTIAISDFRSNLPSLINQVSEYMKRFVISVSGKPKAVVMSLEELESLEETAEILSDPIAYKKIRIGEKQAKLKKGILLKNLKI